MVAYITMRENPMLSLIHHSNPLDYRAFSLLRSKYTFMSINFYMKFIEHTESQL